MLSRIFIDRPIFAWVIAIIIMMLGIGGIFSLPVEQYPDIAPPQVNIRATYPGASAATLESSVTQVIEQQLTGIDGMIYFQSTSNAAGQVTVTVTFDKGTDPDIAQVQVQNAIQSAISRLPQQVQQQGVRVTKGAPDLLLIVGIFDTTDKSTNFDVSDWLTTNMQDELSRIPGVGDVNVFGSSYAMRIWLDPQKLASFHLMPGDVITAISNQNTEVAAGEIGGLPQPQGQLLNATVTAQSKLQTPEEFRNIILKSDPSGAQVLLSDVARAYAQRGAVRRTAPRCILVETEAISGRTAVLRYLCARIEHDRDDAHGFGRHTAGCVLRHVHGGDVLRPQRAYPGRNRRVGRSKPYLGSSGTRATRDVCPRPRHAGERRGLTLRQHDATSCRLHDEQDRRLTVAARDLREIPRDRLARILAPPLARSRNRAINSLRRSVFPVGREHFRRRHLTGEQHNGTRRGGT